MMPVSWDGAKIATWLMDEVKNQWLKFHVEEKRVGAGVCCQTEICDKKGNVHSYIHIY